MVQENENKNRSTKKIFSQRAAFGGLHAVIDPNDSSGLRNLYLHYLHCKILERKIQGTNLKILDFGCGNGRFFDVYNNQGINDVLASDVSAEMLEGAKKRAIGLQTKFKFQLLDVVPPYLLPQKYFDIAIVWWVLQHIEDDNVVISVLQEISNSLQTDGTIICFERTAKKQQIQFLDDEFYVKVRSLDEIKDLFGKSGFFLKEKKLVNISGTFFQKVLFKFPYSFLRYFIPFFVWWDLNIVRYGEIGEERADCLYVFQRRGHHI